MKKFPNKKFENVSDFLFEYTEIVFKAMNNLDMEQVNKIIKIIEDALGENKNIFVCGNGGSSAISDHLVCDFSKGIRDNSILFPKVISLTSNSSLISAISNDISHDEIFSFQLENYSSAKDVLLAISSSGNSKNIVNALEYGKRNNLTTISFTGFTGGKASIISDYNININANNYGIVEDAHQSLMHIISQYIKLKIISGEVVDVVF